MSDRSRVRARELAQQRLKEVVAEGSARLSREVGKARQFVSDECQIEVEIRWDSPKAKGGDLRVIVSADFGGLDAFSPETVSDIVKAGT